MWLKRSILRTGTLSSKESLSAPLQTLTETKSPFTIRCSTLVDGSELPADSYDRNDETVDGELPHSNRQTIPYARVVTNHDSE